MQKRVQNSTLEVMNQPTKTLYITGISRISSGKILYLLDGAFCLFFILKVVQNAPSKKGIIFQIFIQFFEGFHAIGYILSAGLYPK